MTIKLQLLLNSAAVRFFGDGEGHFVHNRVWNFILRDDTKVEEKEEGLEPLIFQWFR